jgi:hypothetical protein
MLNKIVSEIRNFEGLKRKKPIDFITSYLKSVSSFGDIFISFGDDSAVIKNKDEYLLLSCDGVLPSLVSNEPYAAGKVAVMVNVNDIYAMGGRPIAMVNILAVAKKEDYELIIKGIKKGCEKFKVPMVGGHIHPDANENSISVAILGKAKKLLTSYTAKEDENLILAIDLDGKPGCKSVRSWDSNSGKSSDDVLKKLETLVYIAENELSCTCKDVSNAGILGSIATLLETSKKGAEICIEKIPKPESIELINWLKIFPSFGFILSVNKKNTKKCLNIFQSCGIEARVIGEVIKDKKMKVKYFDEESVLFDFEKDKICG